MDTLSEEALPDNFRISLERWMEHKKNCPECARNKARTSCKVGDELLERISELQWQIAQAARKLAG